MEISLHGKTVLVTGASRGIGRTITETVVKAGASKVYAACILKDELIKLSNEVPNVVPIHIDLSKWSETESKLKELEAVDCLVNNAGVLWVTEPGSITENDFDSIFAVNVKAVINVTQIISGKMIEAGKKGSIVNLSSITAKKSFPRFMIYCTSKATVDHITHNFALELAPKGIRVNAINPWIVNTQMGNAVPKNEAEAEMYRQHTPMGRFIETPEIAKVVLFLLSDWSSAICGVTLPIDCGLIL